MKTARISYILKNVKPIAFPAKVEYLDIPDDKTVAEVVDAWAKEKEVEVVNVEVG